MQNKAKIIFGLLVLAALAAALLWRQPGPDSAPLQTQQVETSPAGQQSEGGQEVNPVSLPALMQKEFTGSDLKLGRVLDDNASYTRYYITYKSGELTISGIMNIPKGPG